MRTLGGATMAEKMQPGTKWRLDFGEGNPNNKLIHVIAIVDEQEIVYKTWWKHKQVWHYAVESAYTFWLCYIDGALKQVKG